MKSLLLSLGMFVLFPSVLARAETHDTDLVTNPTVTMEGNKDKVFQSLQEAIDTSPPGSVLHLSAGRFDERITINKAITLVGASNGKTLLGPSEESQLKRWTTLEQLYEQFETSVRATEEQRPKQESSESEVADIKAYYQKMQSLMDPCVEPVIKIEEAAGVTLRSLWVTMPLAPREGNGLQVTSAIEVNKSHVELQKCAVVGCMSTGINIEGDSKAQISECLIAACWGTGITASSESNVKLRDSDIRNNYHYNVKLASEQSVIQGCRISGTAWSGVVCSGRTIGNIIYHNSRGIYSAGNGVVKHNLIYKNGAGASNWSANSPLYESNVFLENKLSAVRASGPGEPKFRKNLFEESSTGILYGSMKITGGELPPPKDFHINQNVFWRVDSPIVLRKSRDGSLPDEKLDIVREKDNRELDPEVLVDDQDRLSIGNQELIVQLGLSEVLKLSFKSPWEITPEELAMIPDDGTVDSKKWKKRPRLVSKY